MPQNPPDAQQSDASSQKDKAAGKKGLFDKLKHLFH
jgi:hypothetical protein